MFDIKDLVDSQNFVELHESEEESITGGVSGISHRLVNNGTGVIFWKDKPGSVNVKPIWTRGVDGPCTQVRYADANGVRKTYSDYAEAWSTFDGFRAC